MKVGFIGLGRMGTPMARNIAAGGFELAVWNRTPEKAAALAAELGAVQVATPQELAQVCDVTVTMLADDDAINDVYRRGDGLMAGIDNTITIDMSTVAVATTEALSRDIAAIGGSHVDAPVSGSTAAAEAKTLMIMAAGDAATVETVAPVLEAMGTPVMRVGESGAGSTIKLAINSIIFAINQAVTEALLMAEQSGVDRGIAYDAFCNSAAGAPVVKYRKQVFVEPGTTPVSFTMDLAIKDMELIIAQATSVGVSMPAQQASLDIMQAAADSGMSDNDMGETAVFMRDALS